MSVSQQFIRRNLAQRQQAEAKTLADATTLIRAQSQELNQAADYAEAVNAQLAHVKRQLSVLHPQLAERLYSPLWNLTLHPDQRSQPVPNTLWLLTSLALIAIGVWMVL